MALCVFPNNPSLFLENCPRPLLSIPLGGSRDSLGDEEDERDCMKRADSERLPWDCH